MKCKCNCICPDCRPNRTSGASRAAAGIIAQIKAGYVWQDDPNKPGVKVFAAPVKHQL